MTEAGQPAGPEAELSSDVGTLQAEVRRLRRETEQLSMEIFAREAERARYVLEAKRWEKAIRLIQHIQEQVAHESSSDRVLPSLVKAAAERLGFDEVAVLFIHRLERDSPVIVMGEHVGLEELSRSPALLRPFVDEVLQTGRGVLASTDEDGQLQAAVRSRNFLLLPFLGSGESPHCLFLGRFGASTIRRPKLTRRDVETYQAMAEQLGLLLRQKEYLSVVVNAGARLEHEVRERTRALEVARTQAEDANRSKTAFLSAISHELRTPLNGILGYAQLLQRSQHADESTGRGIRVIRESAEHLLVLIEGLLDLGRIEAGRMELSLEEVHLQSFVNVLFDLVDVRARAKGLQLRIQVAEGVPESIEVDPTKLRQVLMNLLGNAVKFTSSGTVTLLIERCRDIDENQRLELRFEVQDEGAGIAKEDRDRIFQEFEQAGGLSSRRGGVGLGLPVSRRIVQAMGGELQVESQLGRGSRFWFSLPVRETETKTVSGGAPDVVGYEGARKCVLIVDDDRLSRLFLADALTRVGFRVREAEDGYSALEQLREDSIDLVVTDIRMPRCDGYSLKRTLEEWPDPPPIIATSASVSEPEQERIERGGFVGFLPKPLDLMHVFEVVGNVLELTWRVATAANEEESPRSIQPPPVEVLDRLEELANRGSITRIKREVEEIREAEPAYRSFCDQVESLARVVDDAGIMAFIARMRQVHNDNQ